MTGFYNTPMGNFYQNRMNNIAGGYNLSNPYQNVPPAPVQQPTNEFPCRPVTNKEEAWAASLSDGVRPHIFTDFANKKIYVKYIDNACNARLDVYSLESMTPQHQAVEEPKNVDITSVQSDIEQKLNERIAQLEGNIENLNKEIKEIKGGLENAELQHKSTSNSKSSKQS